MNRRTFLKALAAIPVGVALAPLVSRTTPRVPFRLDPRIQPGVVYILDDKYHFEDSSFYPAWLDDDGTILKIDNSEGYVGTFRWVS